MCKALPPLVMRLKRTLQCLVPVKLDEFSALVGNLQTPMYVVQVRINLSKKVKGARTEPDLEYTQIPRVPESKLTLN
jgi:hypothetical protein